MTVSDLKKMLDNIADTSSLEFINVKNNYGGERTYTIDKMSVVISFEDDIRAGLNITTDNIELYHRDTDRETAAEIAEWLYYQGFTTASEAIHSKYNL
jgi:hypothetical protein